jgi:hypothetical protein
MNNWCIENDFAAQRELAAPDVERAAKELLKEYKRL